MNWGLLARVRPEATDRDAEDGQKSFSHCDFRSVMASGRLDGDVAELFPDDLVEGIVGVISQLVIEVSQQFFDGLDCGIGQSAFVDVGVRKSHGW